MRLFAEVDRFHIGMEHMVRVARNLKAARAGSLRIASMSALSLSYMTEGLTRFCTDRPELEISLEALNSRSVLQARRPTKWTSASCRSPATTPGLDVIPVPNLSAACMLPAKHPLARKQVIRQRDLDGHALISLGHNSPLRARVDLALAAAKVTSKRPIETSLGVSACALAAGGLGIAIVDPFTAAYSEHPGLARRKLSPAIPFEFAFVLPAHQPRPAVVSQFIAVMMKLFRERVAT